MAYHIGVRWLRAILVIGVVAVVQLTKGQQQSSLPDVHQSISAVEYRNTQYDFCLSLPKDWKGYSVLVDEWHGYKLTRREGDVIVAQGPLVIIRHPNWTPEEPRQDIPIMAFTRAQWRAVQKGAFSVSSAPFGPGELGRNHNYVFALPPRYNYAFPMGYEEVERIVKDHFLHAPCKRR